MAPDTFDPRDSRLRLASPPPVETVPVPAWKTTMLGIVKNLVYVAAILTASFSIDITSTGIPVLPKPGSQKGTYIVFFVLVAARVALSLLQAKATADREPTAPPGAGPR